MSLSILAVITDNPEIGRACLQDLSKHPEFTVQIIDSIEAFRNWVAGKAITGIIVDLRTLLRSSQEEKNFINELGQAIPVAKVRLLPQAPMIAGSVDAESLSGEAFFNYLIRTLKDSEWQRRVREFPRRTKILNIRAYHEYWGKEPLLTNTVDLSEGGAFIICTKPPLLDTLVEVEIFELPEVGRLKARIRWILEWGKTTSRYPGLGLQFVGLTEKQRDQLHGMVGLIAQKIDLDDFMS
jgi:hypothetical protein